jgi:hypothetical protein
MFSPIQQKVINRLGKKRMKVSELAEKVYEDAKIKPLSPRTAITSAIEYINYKCEKNNFNWRIVGEGMGRNGKTIYRKKV